MPTIDFDKKYAEYLNRVNSALKNYFDGIKTNPPVLGESMQYSVMLGGKRVRPVLMFAVGEAIGLDIGILEPYAIALEMIHTYSLIHDDLPEMDNDDFRRGKPSNHKVFGTANAVLAGDGLLNTAYSVLLGECFKGTNYVSAAKSICDLAGIYGMIAGQSADIFHENDKNCDESSLEYIFENKTSKLITAAVTTPTIINGGQHYSEMLLFGKKLGYLFQLTDDILDATGSFENLGKSIGKDEKENKLTAVKLYGVNDCRLRVDIIADDCHKILDCINCDVEFLHYFTDFVTSRVN